MKKLLFLLLVLSAGLQAQIVNIPDPAFKAALIEDGVDTNNDGNIQISEAAGVTYLNVQAEGITDMTGISSFTALLELDASQNLLVAFSLSGVTSVTSLLLNGNPSLATISLQNLPALQTLECDGASLTAFSVAGTPTLKNFSAKNMTGQGCAIDLSDCHMITQIYLQNSPVTSLDCHGNTTTAYLYLDNNPLLVSIDLSDGALWLFSLGDMPVLTEVNVNGSSLTEFNAINCPLLNELDLSGIEGGMFQIYITNCGLTTLNLENVVVGNMINVTYCPLTSINLNGTKCNTLDVSHCDLVELDASQLKITSGGFITATFNNLQTVLAKNGFSEGLYLANNPDLQFICVDSSQLQVVQVQYPNVAVSPYCFLTPGGNFNGLSGSVTFDLDNDGCDAQDPGQPFTALSFTSGNNQYTTFSLTDGDYLSYIAGTGTYVIQPAFEDPSLFTVTPPLSQLVLSGTTTSADLDFCITPNGIHHDVEVTIAPLSVIRPGFDASYAVTYRNKGNQVENGQVSFQFDDDKLDVVSTSQAPANSATGNLSWTFTGLLPYESRTIIVTVNANSPVETPAVNIGDIMTYNSSVTLLQTDENPVDNAFAFHHTVVGAYDPNDITCLEGDIVSPSLIGKYLHYHVNFENTGNFPAENVVVRMKMDTSKFDMASLQFMGSSHQPRVQRNGDLIEFFFEGIQLPAEGKGYIQFKIKTKNTLVTGNSVSQKADIYFDFNAPVATNTATTTFQQLSTVTPSAEAFLLWPNPASDVVTISGASEIESVAVLNLLGQEVYRQKGNGRGAQVNISSLPAGNYLVRVKAAGGEQLLKLVKK